MNASRICLFLILFLAVVTVSVAQAPRTSILLETGWETRAPAKEIDEGLPGITGAASGWLPVRVPHTWDTYEGYRRLLHGNKHGSAWYKKEFTAPLIGTGKRCFLFFEGVGSYATVWLNNRLVGSHAGGRTTFTLDVSDAVKSGKTNLLEVRADHPAGIKDLPWVCGGCSEERGFSEGSQPMGIFRPVHLVITNQIRVAPFGVHIWNDTTVTERSAKLKLETELKNYGEAGQAVTVVSTLFDRSKKALSTVRTPVQIGKSSSVVVRQNLPELTNVHLWQLDAPYLYTLVTEIKVAGKVVDKVETPYGIRWISWSPGRKSATKQFFLNGKPVFINGIAEYEHLLGGSHAFTNEEIRTRAKMIKQAGFNAFRDAHQPHNLLYQEYWDSMGILSWTQLSAHVWYDTPAFRENFKKLLAEWVKERRNNPSVVLWGLQNESKLPEDFARECTELIRKLDPTASQQRKVTTCNGGTGTDWDVPQNWTGTYGGDPATYAADLKKQVLVGEYGAWRTLDLHTSGPLIQNGPYSEERISQLMEQKIGLAESVRDSVAGHFFWLFTSHDNPGRVQSGEALRELDRIGPVNYKGLLTPWEEPLDVFYMFRSNYASKIQDPMVHIVSHTWPNRWTVPGVKDSITVYSNCDEVELFNDVGQLSLGRKKNRGTGTHFQWDGVNIRYNVLYAIGYVNGKAVVTDKIILDHLPKSPSFEKLKVNAQPVLSPQKNYHYAYRVNCGGPAYTDSEGNLWSADRHGTGSNSWGSYSWTDPFAMPAYFASQRKIREPINGTVDWPLFQSFRYGRDQLRYTFPLPNGDYRIELYFAEPWLGSGSKSDFAGMRLFDVAVNRKTVLKDLDLWKEAGFAGAVKKVVDVRVTNGQAEISFPRVASGQAVISAIAIASLKKITPAVAPQSLITRLYGTEESGVSETQTGTWLDTGDKQYDDSDNRFSSLPPELYGADYIRFSNRQSKYTLMGCTFTLSRAADVYVALDSRIKEIPGWLSSFENTGKKAVNDAGFNFNVYKKRYPKSARVDIGGNGILVPRPESYSVFVNEATAMEPAYDSKPVISHKITTAALTGKAEKVTINTKDAASLTTTGDAVTWNISPGAADKYSFTIRYANLNQKSAKAILTLRAADGTLMNSDTVELFQSKPGKWNYLSSSSGTMINAGHYKLSIQLAENGEVGVYDLEVQ